MELVRPAPREQPIKRNDKKKLIELKLETVRVLDAKALAAAAGGAAAGTGNTPQSRNEGCVQ
jgi:hypothetical protein